MLNPMTMTRLADLLRQGVVMKTAFQPYEAHLQYLLQWMIDYNLYGCDYIDCGKVRFRGPVPSYETIDDTSHLWHDRSIKNAWITPESMLQRVSHCSIEVDICVQDILNRHAIKHRPLHQDFYERLNPLAPDEKLVASMAGLWKDETRRRKAKMSNAAPGSSPFPPEVLVSMSADPRNSQPGGWIHEAEFRNKVQELIADERSKSDGSKLSFETFVQKAKFDSTIRTSLESVEDLYPENLRPALGIVSSVGTIAGNYDLDVDADREVDELRLFSFGDDSLDADLADMQQDTLQGNPVQVETARPFVLDETTIRLQGTAIKDERDVTANQAVVQSLPNNADRVYPSVNSARGNVSDGFQPEQDTVRTSLQLGVNPSAKRLQDNVFSSIGSLKRQKTDAAEKSAHSKSISAVQLPTTDEPLSLEGTIVHNGVPDSAARSVFKEHLQIDNHHITIDPRQHPKRKAALNYDASVFLSPGYPPRDSTHTPKSVQFDDPTLDRSATSKAKQVESRTKSKSTHRQLHEMLRMMRNKFPASAERTLLVLADRPPSSSDITETMVSLDIDPVIYQDAYYSNELDVPDRTREWAGKEFKLESLTVPFLPDFDPDEVSLEKREATKQFGDRTKQDMTYECCRRYCGLRSWTIAESPPSYKDVAASEARRIPELSSRKTVQQSPSKYVSKKATKLSQIDGPTQKNKHGFKYTQSRKSSGIIQEAQYMSTMSLEVHVNTRRNLVPDPEEDEIQCVFWCLQRGDGANNIGTLSEMPCGIVVCSEDEARARMFTAREHIEVQVESSELDLLNRMIEIVRTHDPDVLTGYEVHGGSWGYLIERARLKYDYNLCDEFSRMRSQSHGRFGKDADKWGFNNTSTIRVTGRHMINIWRAMRSEMNLLQYTMENVVFHLLRRRIPHYSWSDLTAWYTSGNPADLMKVVNYYTSRIVLDLEILEKNELIPRTSEQARLLGVDFFAVFSRGSQFKVESLMFRIAKPENFMLVSPSRKQVGGQNALECLPLVMEPQSAFYNSPLLVLDFQSLYPSVMIAYNYCYSTFLGRIVDWRGTNKMGFSEYRRQQRLLELLQDHINIAPNGMMFARPEIRKSLLAKMLGEILETRVMVKSGMKADKDDKALQQLLNNRQLALKLIANVTYGYTSASFSGRMPCSEIADSIVQTGRETLERAIALIHSVKRWGAEVVYGDTDSIFVYLKGRTKDQAFDIGTEIAKVITNMNPRPIKLKFEKVYLPCVLLAKKRYVGFKYETRDQKEPDFDAKGIETVRRDGTPAEQKIEEKALKILFRTADLSQVKLFFQKQCEKIMKGSVSIQDFCFAKEVKLGTYSDRGPPPPGALISTKRMLQDARAEPQYGERVPYVVISGAPGARLIDRCVAPEELLMNEHCELDAEYYISKNLIPPLERIFNLMGANVRTWYDEMPKVQRVRKVEVKMNALLHSHDSAQQNSKKTLESYLKSTNCLVCNEKLEGDEPLCEKCMSNTTMSLLSLQTKLNTEEAHYLDIRKVCQSCSELPPVDDVRCDSKDCPVFYTRMKQRARLQSAKGRIEPVIGALASLDIAGDLDW